MTIRWSNGLTKQNYLSVVVGDEKGEKRWTWNRLKVYIGGTAGMIGMIMSGI